MAASRTLSGVVLLLALCPSPAGAEHAKHHASNTSSDPRSRVRPASTFVGRVLNDALQNSPMISALVERIDASNVIVHVECARFRSFVLEGRALFIVSTRDVRYVRVQVDCLLVDRELMAIIGHELQHAAEIAAAPDVVDERSFAGLLQKIGFLQCCSTSERYETNAALDAGDRVRDEMLVHRVVSTARDSSR